MIKSRAFSLCYESLIGQCKNKLHTPVLKEKLTFLVTLEINDVFLNLQNYVHVNVEKKSEYLKLDAICK